MHGSIFLFNEVNRCKNLTFCENFGSLFCLLTTKRKAGTMLCCQTVASWGTVVVRDRLAAFDSFRHYMVWCCFHLVCLCVCVWLWQNVVLRARAFFAMCLFVRPSVDFCRRDSFTTPQDADTDAHRCVGDESCVWRWVLRVDAVATRLIASQVNY